MKSTRTKYCIVFFLFSVFLLRGLETVLPLFEGYFTEQSGQEMEANSEAKNSQEKVEEKLIEKEFLNHFLSDYTSNIKFTLISSHLPVRSSPFERKIFLPVYLRKKNWKKCAKNFLSGKMPTAL